MLRSAANLFVAYTVGTVIVLSRVVRAERQLRRDASSHMD